MSNDYITTLSDVGFRKDSPQIYQYVYFTNYYIRIDKVLEKSVMEIRRGDCLAPDAFLVRYNQGLELKDGPIAIGMNRLFLVNGVQYVILVGSWSGFNLPSGSLFIVGFCGTHCNITQPPFQSPTFQSPTFNNPVIERISISIVIALSIGILVLLCIVITIITCCILQKQRRAKAAALQKASQTLPQEYMQPLMYVSLPVANIVTTNNSYRTRVKLNYTQFCLYHHINKRK
jgi:hypothetical protein